MPHASTRTLSAASHVEVLYHFHLVAPDAVHAGARRPRDNPAWPAVGIFAQRGKVRPNRLGVSICRIESVAGLDLSHRGRVAVRDRQAQALRRQVDGLGAQPHVPPQDLEGEAFAEIDPASRQRSEIVSFGHTGWSAA
jgi:hypothetical protein